MAPAGAAQGGAPTSAAADMPAAAAVAPAEVGGDSVGAAPADSFAVPPEAVARVGRIRVAGNAHTDSARIVRTFDVPAGSRFAEDAVRRGIRKLFALGLFSDVWVEKQPRGTAMDLAIHVSERPRIGKIAFTGNRKKQTGDLEKKLFLHPGDIYSPTTVQTQVDSLLKLYRDDGYARAGITAAADTVPGGLDLKFTIAEGEKVKIARIELAGARAFPAGKLRKRLKSKAHGFLGGGEIKDENFAEDQEKLEAFYRSNGYRDMRVTGHELKPGADPRRLTLVISVEEGRRYRAGAVAWEGNIVIPAADLEKLWRPRPDERYDLSRIEKVQGLAYAAYAELGYLYLTVEPREAVRDSDRVDITFHVAEGQPSSVRHVNVLGNKATREKVIRREIDLHEGDRFRRSALVRTQGDLSRLGLFEEVMPDFSPAESTDVDINIKVKEKQVGTASAGAGYTGDTGFTGFLELGHNNVLGNGQSLSLRLERGPRRQDYFVSFTEPWFHDSPTLLGFSAFNTSLQRDLYKEQRRGGSAKIGRPLPWPDYSRGAIGYRLEDVTISQFGTTLNAQDSIALSGIQTGRPLRTSSVDLDFNRNSTDNAFYPTRGTRLGWSSELAGGPFLGSVSFIKNRVEGRLYLPSFLRRVTTMVKARVGWLGIWLDQSAALPPYERFRLGGGSTVDPLRGYDDYQVVPEKFIRDVVIRRDTTFYTSGSDSGKVQSIRPTIERVRYPGGRYFTTYTVEQQFPIVAPLHGVVFFDAGNTWDQWAEIQPFRLKAGAGIGFRMEIPLLGNIGFDYGYGFNRDDGPRAKGHFLLGNINF